MARVAALVPDLLFGSKVQAALEQAGHEVDLLTSEPEAWDEVGGIDVLVVDLTTDASTPSARRDAEGRRRADDVRTLGFFAHVEPEVRERALAAGFDQVVPRSRMAREGATLVDRLAGGAGAGAAAWSAEGERAVDVGRLRRRCPNARLPVGPAPSAARSSVPSGRPSAVKTGLTASSSRATSVAVAGAAVDSDVDGRPGSASAAS